MTHLIEDLHVYLRDIRQGERTSLSVLAALVHERATVLDLGCGNGALGQYLTQTRNCTIDGVTLSETEAKHARPHYRHVAVDNLETCDLDSMFAGQRYDYIVCADVLEHLSRPERVLAACRGLLSNNGRLLISVPNASYSGLVAELMHGEFRYREEGLLDRTHLRFFTRQSLIRFLTEQSWALDTLDTIERELPDSEFATSFDSLAPAAARYLLSAPDALTYQFIGAARPVVNSAELSAEFLPGAIPAQARFTAQLYIGVGGEYSETRKLTTSGVIGEERQTIRFTLKAYGQPITSLRLDPADRPGFLHLYRISLRTPDGACAWEWIANTATRSLLAATPHSQILWQAPLPAASSATLLLLAGDDPWLELPLAPSLLVASALEGSVLDIELGWPMSADYLALAHTVRPLNDRIDQLEHSAHGLLQQNHRIQAALVSEQNRSALLETNNQALSQQRVALQQNALHLKQELDNLSQHLRTIENSTVFRATRPIVHAKMRMDRFLGRVPEKKPGPKALPQPLPLPHHPVDVIVPVYRGLQDTQRCIESVLASTCQTAYRLVIVNDASPEPEVTQWLRECAEQNPGITLLENAENLGFVGTVNRGMALSPNHDVLLLNSDTEVANDWLDRLRQAAYGDQKIASVTPFSNNATICSYPRFCEANLLPPGYDTARLDLLCAQTNAQAVVDVPTGVGFCMYIRRDCLSELGLFDTENFGKGYGEENDFCQRAAAAGWRNLHALDTFVLHTGGVSFGASKSPRERVAMETLRRLHPGYETEVQRFVQADPAQPYRLALDVARVGAVEKPAVLAVLHDRAGGTVRHVRELAEHLADQAIFFTLTPAPNRCVHLQFARKEDGFKLVFRLTDQYGDLLRALRALGIGHLHYHHLLGHDAPIFDLSHQLGLAYDFTVHDFYSYCTHISMTGNDSRYAGEAAPGHCACCSPDDIAPGGGSVADWRHRNREFLTGARLVLAPSHDTAGRIQAFAPGARVRMVPHTDTLAAALQPPPMVSVRSTNRPLKIAVLGALSAIKGADILEAVAEEAAQHNAPIEFHLLGYGYRHLQSQPRARLTVHGGYAEEDLPSLLQWLQPDLVWFPAQWPETYSYTLSACLLAGLPVVGPNLGAFPERLAHRPWSWVMRWNMSASEWLATFIQLKEQHFDIGIPPHPPTAPALFSDHGDPWDYHSHYLHALSNAASAAALPREFLAEHCLRRTDTHGTKSRMLLGIMRLRSHPLLRGVAQRIPQHWQTTVKNWLRA